MFLYSLYGLTVASNVELPAIGIRGAHAIDLEVRSQTLDLPGIEWQLDGSSQYAIDSYCMRIRYPQVGTFVIEGTQRILFERHPAASDNLVYYYLLGPVLGLLLRRRRNLVLHANVVAWEGRGALLLGASGAGKSTLSAGLRQRGFLVLSDDLGVVDLDGSVPCAQVGVPRIRLTPVSYQALGMSNQEQHGWDAYFGKAVLHWSAPVPMASVPLRAIYVLKPGDKPGIRPLHRQTALMALIRHAYLKHSLGVTQLAPYHFERSVATLRSVPAFELTRGEGFRRFRDCSVSSKIISVGIMNLRSHMENHLSMSDLMKVRLSEGQLSSPLSDIEIAIMHYRKGAYYGVEEVGAFIWQQLMRAPQTVGSLLDGIQGRI